ncbi:restriction endonuclease subunit S [Citrobacter braakii]|uniref:restriction endonuclease subunit S n=1 Tax=Citrobacter braakii TaxID=57706 RepID=UPI001904C785|nr:restriction endonuclease subunit S [Citrobacter braakii]MBJ9144364.1 restriction endonuclease subunit S [Citrobacter braakii]
MAREIMLQKLPVGWSYDLLDNIAERCSGHTPSKSFPEYWNGGIKWISLSDSYRLDKGYVYETDKEISLEGIKNSSAEVHPAETVILSRDAGVGKSGVMATPMAVSQHFIAWKCDNKEKLHSWYLYNWLQLNKEEFERQAVGSTIKTIGLPYFKKLKIAVPPFDEQKKIAQILSTWDKAISVTEKLLTNSQQQKKALMQQLLTGKKRLLDDNGNNFHGEWKIFQIGTLLKEIKRPVQWNDNDEYSLLSVKRRSEGVVLREKLKGYQILTKKMNYVKSGDFLISKMQVVHGATGLVTSEFNNYHISDSYIALNSRNPSILDVQFFSWVCKQKIMYHKAYLCSYGVHIEKMTFNLQMYLQEKVCIPKTSEEQQKIATVLSAADAEISTLEKKLACLKNEKKALMQQLLTGKRRVSVPVKVEEKEAVSA